MIGLEFPPWPCVYVISGGSRRVKIGYTTDMANRLSALQASSPRRLRIMATTPGTLATEAWLHKRFGKYRLHGEWFDLSSANMRLLMRYMSGDEPIPTKPVQARTERTAKARFDRQRREAAQRWNGYAPSTGQPKYSKVKVTRIPPA